MDTGTDQGNLDPYVMWISDLETIEKHITIHSYCWLCFRNNFAIKVDLFNGKEIREVDFPSNKDFILALLTSPPCSWPNLRDRERRYLRIGYWQAISKNEYLQILIGGFSVYKEILKRYHDGTQKTGLSGV